MADTKPGPQRELPLLPLRGALVFPNTVVPLNVGRRRSVSAIEDSVRRDRRVVLASQRELTVDEPGLEDLYEVGTVAVIKQITRSADDTVKVVVEGKSRCRILSCVQTEPFFRVSIEEVSDEDDQSQETEVLMRTVLSQFEKFVRLSKKLPAEALVTVTNVGGPGRLADTITTQLQLKPEEKQDVLSAIPLRERLEKVSNLLNRELEIVELEKRINVRVRKQMEKTQREYYLREQMKAIQRELGDREDRAGECEEYRDRLSELELPEEVEDKVIKEIERLEKMPPMAAEAVVVRTYLDLIMALPWSKETGDQLDLDSAQRILDEDHYGLTQVKERIVEYLAIRKLVDHARGPILCLVGPPGVGKTSLGKSIARATGRKFVRISLGGVRDEAEIRGHRRTYVGALPGRIIQGMRQAGTCNPVFLLDEVDKMSADFRGDPAAALLEVLDPEQNCRFSDHYLEVPFDLSKVMFVTTANQRHNIPRPLLDRMETIELPGYSEEEKLKIAGRYLLSRQLTEHGLGDEKVTISTAGLQQIIRYYTREAGVRNLEREIARVCRKAARYRVGGGKRAVRVTPNNLEKYLGVPRYRHGTAELKQEIGAATGVGWTDTGGDILTIEVTVMKGKGALQLTGKLGEVMQESARAALSYVRSRASLFGVDENFYAEHDIHIHVPEGGMPKEGPSAGIAMATALLSAVAERSVRQDVAMTGEITLRGRVLPVGGVKEKLLAAHRAGCRVMVIPSENLKDIEDVPAAVLRRLEVVPVDHLDEALKVALGDEDVGAVIHADLGPLTYTEQVTTTHVDS